MNAHDFTEAVEALAKDNGITLHAIKASDDQFVFTITPVVPGPHTFVYSDDTLRDRDYAIAEATLDWSGVDRAHRAPDHLNGDIDIDLIRSTVHR